MTTQVLPPRWSLQSFELELAVAETASIVKAPVHRDDSVLHIEGFLHHSSMARLASRAAFASAIKRFNKSIQTTQNALEIAAGGGSRKITSHALHGLHPYKGKFYPQLARSLLNVCGVERGGLIIDPFAGCGTSVLEASILGIRALGIDANPLAVLVSQAKLQLLGCPASEVKREFSQLRTLSEGTALPDEDYLVRWFPGVNLDFLRRAIPSIRELSSQTARNGATVALSSVLREASWQDPRQLRTRRRRDGDNPLVLEDLFYRALDSLVRDLAAVQAVPELKWKRMSRLSSMVIEGDSRDLTRVLKRHMRRKADAVVTSPPYASALPYIDTDRLSLCAFGLLSRGNLRKAESRQIGNREITERERVHIENQMAASIENDEWIPYALREILDATLIVSREPESGCRKRRTPALLYNYFRDMRTVLSQISDLVREGGKVAIVIGANSAAGPSGTVIQVPTPEILIELARQNGLEIEGDFSKRLTSYGAPETVHQRNAMNADRVLLFRRLKAEQTGEQK